MAQAKTKKTGAVGKKLVGMADVVIAAAQRAKDPTFEIPIRALSNVSFNPRRGLIEMGEKKQSRSFFNVGMAKKFMQTMLVADALAELQQADLTTSLREIYYRTKHTIQDSHENTFDTQDESDPDHRGSRSVARRAPGRTPCARGKQRQHCRAGGVRGRR
jgi:DNA topoisomerase-6 subunit A